MKAFQILVTQVYMNNWRKYRNIVYTFQNKI